MNAIYERYSHKSTFNGTPVTREQLTQILRAGIAAPSGRNAQTCEFIGVDDPALLRELGEIMGAPPAQTAQASIVVVTEPQMTFGGLSFHVQDYSAAIENMLLTITELGLASVWEEGFRPQRGGGLERIAALLGVPGRSRWCAICPSACRRFGASSGSASLFLTGWFNGYRK